ncbi:hypothetical protein DSO57_1000667 [Entomophthora muscae]|uniref:Uncharacterized protein n=1 Tax=Entomophthora muscae TaxID=34485 RepID=A0ACC2TX09_9FUNG|nr:hypothetical protein DSO57_1000667 [Entomophthora muscae]
MGAVAYLLIPSDTVFVRYSNLYQVNTLKRLYCEAEKMEQTSNLLTQAPTGKREDPYILTI